MLPMVHKVQEEIILIPHIDFVIPNEFDVVEFKIFLFPVLPKVFEYVFNKACQSEGINLVLIPRGIYLLWPIVLNGPCNGLLEFVILGTLKAPTDKVFSINVDHWITFQHIDGLIITGGGKLDGQGPSAWNENNCSKDPNCKTLPISLRLNFVNNARISYLHSINSKETHVNIWGCTHMKLNHIHIIAPKDSPNTDGIRIGSSSNIEILNSIIATGDDCVAMSPGSKDIIIQNVKCGPGHGISVGSLGKLPNEEDVSGLWVTNCTFIGTQNGLRVKTWATPYSSNVFNLTFEDIIMDNVNNPIIIDQQYCPRANCQKGNSQVQIQDVKYINIRGTSSSKLAVTFDCSKSKPCENIELNDINLTYKSVGHAASSCSNAKVQIRYVKYRNIMGTSSSKIAFAFECSKGKPCEKIDFNNINLTYHGAERAVASSCSNSKGIANGQQQPRSCI
ncbi:exopolygalacturonase [Quercus suber]|uniref:exopolygalacturonase n=1 Tax=Quercus suber TaxID=58331 RepID=UPI0032DEE8EC